MDVDMNGAEGLAAVALAVRRLGSDRTIVNNMAREIRGAVPSVRRAVRASALATLPHRGGLNAWVARTKVTAQIRRGDRDAGVKIVGGRNGTHGRSDIKKLDAGQVRHPFFGHAPWVTQSVRPGFFTDAVEAEGDTFRAAIGTAVDNAIRQVIP